jgi:hypothetical protein
VRVLKFALFERIDSGKEHKNRLNYEEEKRKEEEKQESESD